MLPEHLMSLLLYTAYVIYIMWLPLGGGWKDEVGWGFDSLCPACPAMFLPLCFWIPPTKIYQYLKYEGCIWILPNNFASKVVEGLANIIAKQQEIINFAQHLYE